MIFDRRKQVEKFEEEFETENLKDKPIFYDLDISNIKKPEELRSFILDSCKGKSYSINLNELTKFESEEFEGIFKGGPIKPIRGLLRAKKVINKGIKHPILTISLSLTTIILLILSFKPNLFNLGLQGKEKILMISSGIAAMLAFLFYSLKKRLVLRMWVKLVGIYDAEEGKADMRVVLAGNSKQEKGREILGKNLSTIYQSITDTFLGKKLPEAKEEKPILKEGKEGTQEKIIEKLSETVDSLDQLDSRLAKGEISEKKYEELKRRLERKRSKYETLLDVVK